jgi:hypothetical protein
MTRWYAGLSVGENRILT